MMPLKRILAEKRSAVVPLALAGIVNIGLYALVVRPLEVKSTGAADRAAAAGAALEAAEQSYAGAKALVAAKTRADQELATFYGKVVPADFSAARRMTNAALPALARKTNVKYQQGRWEIEPNPKNTGLGHLQVRMLLQGEYEAIRQFIYELETAPQFVIIDDVTLAQNDPGKPLLLLTLELSTYYRLGANGS